MWAGAVPFATPTGEGPKVSTRGGPGAPERAPQDGARALTGGAGGPLTNDFGSPPVENARGPKSRYFTCISSRAHAGG